MHETFDEPPPALRQRAAAAGAQRGAAPSAARPLVRPGEPPAGRLVGRLVARLYAAASPALRQRLLQHLLAPLSTLALVAVAAGAFGRWLHRSGGEPLVVPLAELERLAGEPMIELAGFVEQVSPQALEDAARLFTEQPLGLASFSVAAAWLLLRLLRERRRPGC